jgi:nitroimidazol reductase NimA-like FMN-containing flavoprotein (pyridoxamine 5'-phosphate oxidase superfamily)
MLGSLTKNQCERVLLSDLVGRLGCHASGKMYIVPLSYVFEKGYVYAHAKEGLKITMMRKNPNVCFQVDQIDDMAHWRSVVLWGKFEEITTPAAQDKTLKLLTDRFRVYNTSESVKPVFHTTDQEPLKEKKPVLFRIAVEEMTGRFENTESK